MRSVPHTWQSRKARFTRRHAEGGIGDRLISMRGSPGRKSGWWRIPGRAAPTSQACPASVDGPPPLHRFPRVSVISTRGRPVSTPPSSTARAPAYRRRHWSHGSAPALVHRPPESLPAQPPSRPVPSRGGQCDADAHFFRPRCFGDRGVHSPSAAGPVPQVGSRWSNAILIPEPIRCTRMWKSPGASHTRFGTMGAPSVASATDRADSESSRAARAAVKPGGMCWTTRTAAPRSAGRAPNTNDRARGPPVEAAIATTAFRAPNDHRCGSRSA